MNLTSNKSNRCLSSDNSSSSSASRCTLLILSSSTADSIPASVLILSASLASNIFTNRCNELISAVNWEVETASCSLMIAFEELRSSCRVMRLSCTFLNFCKLELDEVASTVFISNEDCNLDNSACLLVR